MIRKVSYSGSRSKGHSGEREICALLTKALGLKKPLFRNVDQVRFGGADIVGLRPWAIEVKRQEQVAIKSFWKQARSQVTKKNPIPVVIYRANHQPWRVLILFEAIAKKKINIGTEKFITLEWDCFLQYIKSVYKPRK